MEQRRSSTRDTLVTLYFGQNDGSWISQQPNEKPKLLKIINVTNMVRPKSEPSLQTGFQRNHCSVMSAVVAAGKYTTHLVLVTGLVIIYLWIAPICPDSVYTVNSKTQNSLDLCYQYFKVYTQWCRFLSQEVREISRFFVAPPTQVRPRPPRDISRAKFKLFLINLHH